MNKPLIWPIKWMSKEEFEKMYPQREDRCKHGMVTDWCADCQGIGDKGKTAGVPTYRKPQPINLKRAELYVTGLPDNSGEYRYGKLHMRPLGGTT